LRGADQLISPECGLSEESGLLRSEDWPWVEMSALGLAQYGGAAVGAVVGVGRGSGAAALANGGVAGAHHGESLLSVAGFQGSVVGVGYFASLAIEFELAESVDCGTLGASRWARGTWSCRKL